MTSAAGSAGFAMMLHPLQSVRGKTCSRPAIRRAPADLQAIVAVLSEKRAVLHICPRAYRQVFDAVGSHRLRACDAVRYLMMVIMTAAAVGR